MALNFDELMALLDHLNSKLPNFNLEDNKSLTKEQLDSVLSYDETSLTKLLLGQQDFITDGQINRLGIKRRSQLLLVQQKVRAKFQEANELLLLLNKAFSESNQSLSNEILRDFYNNYLVWFNVNCFDINQISVIEKIKSQAPAPDNIDDLVVHNHGSNVIEGGKNKVSVIGAGPTGLMAALRLYEVGATVNLLEARSGKELHKRKQIVVLDPTILAELRHYLGTKTFNELFRKGFIFPNGRGFLIIKDLETAMMKRLSELSAKDPLGLQIHTGIRADKIIPPSDEHPSFQVGIENSDVSFDCDYVYCAEGTREDFINARYLLRKADHTTVKSEETPNAFVTMIYDIVEDNPSSPFQREGQLTHIKKVQDEFQPSEEQIASFISGFNKSSGQRLSRLVSSSTNVEEAQELQQAYLDLLNIANYNLKLHVGDNNLRTFEAQGELYIASRVPMAYEHFSRLLNQIMKDKNASAENKKLALGIQQNLQQEFSNLLAIKFPFLHDRRVKLDFQSSQSFVVNPQGTQLAARVLTHRGKELTVLAGGDLFRAPHFYSGSGISSAHAEVNACVDFFKDSQESPEFARSYLLSKMIHIARFVDGKMAEYCNVHRPLYTPVSISIEEVGSEAIAIEQILLKIHEHRDSLKQGLSSFWVLRWLFQGKREDKANVLDQLLSKFQNESTYNGYKNALQDVLTEENIQKLHAHRYSIWSSSSTTSGILVNSLSQSLNTVCSSEHVYNETPEINIF